MKKIVDKKSFLDALHNGLDTRSGKLMAVSDTSDSYWSNVLDVQWKSGIHFDVWMCQFRPGHFDYAVMRDGQQISPTYHSSVMSEAVLRAMQHMIDDIENGKFRKKKTKIVLWLFQHCPSLLIPTHACFRLVKSFGRKCRCGC